MAQHDGKKSGIDRRTLMIGGAAGVGLMVAWAVWPRRYPPSLAAAKGETVFGAWLKIGQDGQVTVAVPQAEMGQGVYTALPQILADELGADWRMVAVEAAPVSALYANQLAAEQWFADAFGRIPQTMRQAHVTRTALMLTGGSTSVRAFEDDLRQAGAAARILLCKTAAARWGVDWRACGTAQGMVIRGKQRLPFGALAVDAAAKSLPADVPLRGGDGGIVGQSMPRLDLPAKVDGSANFAADIRLPGMVFAAVRQGPIGDTRLVRVDIKAAKARVPDLIDVVENERWVAAVGKTWWAANQALDALTPRFETRGQIVNSDRIDAVLDAALDGDGERMASAGDLEAQFKGARVITASYRAGLAACAPLETMTATAAWREGRLTLWMPSQAPGLARAAAAAAIGVSDAGVILHPMMGGGSFGAKLEVEVAAQAAILTKKLGKPVQLTWSRAEDCMHDRFRPPAAARMTARLGPDGRILGWLAKVAAPPLGREMASRLLGTDPAVAVALSMPDGVGDHAAVSGAVPPYRIPAYAIDHHPAEIGVPVGPWRSGADSYTCFFTECFIDELARLAETEPVSYRIGMLGGEARLARCLQTVVTQGEWQGGVAGSGQGVACHALRGSFIAVLAEARLDGGQAKVDRLVAAVDCGRVINPDLVTQQIEGGLLYGMAAALAGPVTITENVNDVLGFGQMRLPLLADCPDITVELIASEADPGGVSEIAVPPVGAAIANALATLGQGRMRSLPFEFDSDA